MNTIHDANVDRILAPLGRIADALDPSGLPPARLLTKSIGAAISKGLIGFLFGLGFWVAASVVGR